MFPLNEMILGIASYGHPFHVNPNDALDASGNLHLYPPIKKSQQPAGDKWDSTASGVDVCGNPNSVSGIFHLWSLIEDGFLTKDETAASGIYYRYDTCNQMVSPLCF